MNAQLDAKRHPPHGEARPDHTLSSAVHAALEHYFEKLAGHEPDNLYAMVMEEVERPLLECVMLHSGGNQTKAAQFLGINRGTLRKKLKQYGIE